MQMRYTRFPITPARCTLQKQIVWTTEWLSWLQRSWRDRSVYFANCIKQPQRKLPRLSYNQDLGVSNHWTSVKGSHLLVSKSITHDLADIVITEHHNLFLQCAYNVLKMYLLQLVQSTYVTNAVLATSWYRHVEPVGVLCTLLQQIVLIFINYYLFISKIVTWELFTSTAPSLLQVTDGLP